MKIVLTLPKKSSFAKHNHRTFDVNMCIGEKLINISIDNNTSIDVSFREIIVVDFHDVAQKIYQLICFRNTLQNERHFQFLKNYAKHNHLSMDFLVYKKTA